MRQSRAVFITLVLIDAFEEGKENKNKTFLEQVDEADATISLS